MSDNGFAADWLALRETFDAAARDKNLALRFAAALGVSFSAAPGERRTKNLLDLGAGTAANFRHLAPLIGGDQNWLLIDHDPLLLSAQVDAIGQWAAQTGRPHEIDVNGISVFTDDAHWRVRGQSLDLARSLETLDLSAVDGVTTTAFLDLASASWLDRLAAWLTTGQRPLLATLTVDGRRIWQPTLDGDALIDRAFRNHQTGDKGFGPALGNNAARYLADRLREFGYATTIACSDWKIGAEHSLMLNRMASEAAAVATTDDSLSTDAIVYWRRHRLAQIESGNVVLTVGHNDLLGVPNN